MGHGIVWERKIVLLIGHHTEILAHIMGLALIFHFDHILQVFYFVFGKQLEGEGFVIEVQVT